MPDQSRLEFIKERLVAAKIEVDEISFGKRLTAIRVENYRTREAVKDLLHGEGILDFFTFSSSEATPRDTLETKALIGKILKENKIRCMNGICVSGVFLEPEDEPTREKIVGLLEAEGVTDYSINVEKHDIRALGVEKIQNTLQEAGIAAEVTHGPKLIRIRLTDKTTSLAKIEALLKDQEVPEYEVQYAA